MTENIHWRAIPYRPIASLGLLGFSAGIPILLIFSTLSLWLNEAGVAKSAVTYFSWAALGYSFKFIWAPVVDSLPLPLLSRWLGRRRGWLLLSQMAVIGAILAMAGVDPAQSLQTMAMACVMLGFASATQDIVIDTYRIECAGKDQQALLSSSYIAGYRIGMVVAGAGALYLADLFGSAPEHYLYSAWRHTYQIMALTMAVGVLTTLSIAEPRQGDHGHSYPYSAAAYARFFALFVLSVMALIGVFRFFPSWDNGSGEAGRLQVFLADAAMLLCALGAAIAVGLIGARSGLADAQMVKKNYLEPVADFLKRYGRQALWILLLIGFYRVSDIVMGVMANLFYQDLGFSKTEIAGVTKVFGLLMTIAGSFIGGFLALKVGIMRMLLTGAILAAATNIAFAWLAGATADIRALTLVIAADNLSAGLAVAAFVAWLSSLTAVSFTATQYALFSSAMTLFPKLLGGYSGNLVEQIGYAPFFLLTAVMGVPVIALILFLQKRLSGQQHPGL